MRRSQGVALLPGRDGPLGRPRLPHRESCAPSPFFTSHRLHRPHRPVSLRRAQRSRPTSEHVALESIRTGTMLLDGAAQEGGSRSWVIRKGDPVRFVTLAGNWVWHWPRKRTKTPKNRRRSWGLFVPLCAYPQSAVSGSVRARRKGVRVDGPGRSRPGHS